MRGPRNDLLVICVVRRVRLLLVHDVAGRFRLRRFVILGEGRF